MVSARTWYILPDSTGDAITIQAGTDSAAVGDTVLVACGIYYEYERGDAECVTIDAQRDFNNPGHVLICDGDSTTYIMGLTLMNGHVPHYGGGLSCSGNVVISNCDIVGNYAEMAGGGVSCVNSPSFTDCGFYGNMTDGSGGGLAGGNPVLTRCHFSGNTSANGSAGALVAGNLKNINDCTFVRNYAHLVGGAIEGDNLTFKKCIFVDNYAIHYGGAIHCLNIELDSCTFYDNECDISYGGAMYIYGGVSKISNCTFYNNGAPDGGVIYSDGDSTIIENSTFSSNSVIENGIIYCRDSSFILKNSIIAFSTKGEAIFCEGLTDVSLTCCDIYGNEDGDWVGCIAGQYGINGNFSTDPLFCQPDSLDFHLAALSDCLPENNWFNCGVLIGAIGLGCDALVGVNDENKKNEHLYLMQNHPNPFNPTTTISFSLPERNKATLSVFNLEGKLVKTLVNGVLEAGQNQIAWDGTNSSGNQVASGVYFYSLKAGNSTLTKKMVLLK